MTALHWDTRPDLTHPILVAAFEGWNDAAEAASGAVRWLHQQWDAKRVARIDAEAYFDFQSVRPQVSLVDGVTRDLQWPPNEFFAAQPHRGGRDALLLQGTEPSYRWRSFCDDILDVVTESGCEMVITLGALLADVPHTRPIRITGTAADDNMARRLGLERSRYEGPTGIVGVLHDTCRRAGLHSVSLWAPVPHYVANPPNPQATLALLGAVSRLFEASTETDDLQTASQMWRQRVDEAVADDDETSAYVRQLEERYDEEQADELASGDHLITQIEDFLRDESSDDRGDESSGTDEDDA